MKSTALLKNVEKDKRKLYHSAFQIILIRSIPEGYDELTQPDAANTRASNTQTQDEDTFIPLTVPLMIC